MVGERGYVNLIKRVLEEGVEVPDRTGVGSLAVFDEKLEYYPAKEFPFSTIRPAPLRLAFGEFWFYLRGHTQTKMLEEKGVNFWRGNTSREFLDKRGLGHLPEGDMGKAYGYQLRNYNDKLDQLVEVYEELSGNPYSRRLYTTFWNPTQSDDMALTPCWHSHQWVVLPDGLGNDVLNLKLLNRSLDTIFGAQFAVQQYALYQICMAKLLGMKVGKLSCDLTQVHIYNNQIDYAEEILSREFGQGGVVTVKKELNTLEDLLNLQWEDIEEVGLEVNRTPFKTPRPPMAV